MEPSEKTEGLTKRQFLRRVVVGGAVMFVAGGGYERPELQTLLGPQVARANGSCRDKDHEDDGEECDGKDKHDGEDQ